MAEGALFDVAKGIIGIAGKLAAKEIALISGVKDKITKLGETVSTIKAVLLHAEAKEHNSERSEAIKPWLKSLKDAMCDADDLLEEISTKKAIIESLLDYANAEENVLVLPIFGIGSLGKTTVTKLVFNDEQIKNHFELKLWVCVSDDFDVKIIVEKIMECVKNKKPEDLEMNTLVNDLQKEINGKRYLLVLDDVWNEDREKWFSLKAILKGSTRGSRILLTTCSEKVAEITQSMQPHKLKGLDDQQSLSLFKKMAFKEGEEPKNASFVEIGK